MSSSVAVDNYTADRGVSESGYFPSTIETARIVNVNLDDWSVDCVSDLGNKRFFDIQVMSPYFHFANGEGIYAMPEVGTLVWICRPSQGRFAAPFVLGYQAPHDEDNDGFRSGRLTLNPGDLMMRTRDENFVILRRGGVVQIGATPIAQRIYVPIRNIIRDFCENYELNAFGGDLTWTTDRDDQTTDGAAPTTFRLRAKEKANTAAHIATLTIGSHGEDDPNTLTLVINESGDEGGAQKIGLSMTKEGDVSWTIENNLTTTVRGDITYESTEGSVNLKAKTDMNLETADGSYNLVAGNAINQESKGKTKHKAGTYTVDSAQISLGAGGGIEPAVLGSTLVSVMNQMCTVIAGLVSTPPTSPVGGAAAIAGPQAQLSTILAQNVKVK